MWEEKSKIEKSQVCLSKVFQLHSIVDGYLQQA